MNEQWKGYADKAAKASSGGKFVKLKDGEAITFAIMGTPGELHQIWEEGKQKPTPVPPGTKGAQTIIGIPVYDVKDKTPRLLQLSVNTFRDLAELVAELGDDRVYRVSRKGSGLTDTKYSVTSIEKAGPEIMERVATETPVSLAENGYRPFQSIPTNNDPDSDLPF